MTLRASLLFVAVVSAAAAGACSSASSNGASASAPAAVRHRADVTPVTRVADAKPGVFIPPFVDCRAPVPGDTTSSADGKVCTNVAISGATEPGKPFASYAACDVVRTQRPYYPAKVGAATSASDPRAKDAALVAEATWARDQVSATACACCHDGQLAPQGAAAWDIRAPGIWLDTVSNAGLALFAGLADSSVLGAYDAVQNHGFDRTTVGLPSTDPARMKKLVQGELARRGVSEAESRAVPPFGGPIYENSVRPPTACSAGVGVDPDGHVLWGRSTARYVYVLEAGSKNPGVPPNLDHPAGTLFRLDVLASADALDEGIVYGTTPDGSFQDTPATLAAPALVKGKTYQLTVLHDVGLPIANCTFVHGQPLDGPPPQPPAPLTPGFGSTCAASSDCAADAPYCALMPGAKTGYCTVTGCKETPSVCPKSWSCFDVSAFQPGAPSICTKP